MVNFCAFLIVSGLINTQCLLPIWVNRTEASKTVTLKRAILKYYLKWLNFHHLHYSSCHSHTSFCFNLSSSQANTICKESSLGREDIGRMGIWGWICCLYHWECLCSCIPWSIPSTISGQPHRKYSRPAGAFEMRKKKNKKPPECLQSQEPPRLCCRGSWRFPHSSPGRHSHGNSSQ